MLLVTDGPLRLGWLAGGVADAGMVLTVIVKGTFLLCPGGAAEPVEEPQLVVGDELAGTDRGELLRYASDFVPFKPCADVLLVGTAHTPGGQAVSDLEVAMSVGSLAKSLYVAGDRRARWGFLAGHLAEPDPFVSMPIGYDRAYGGPRYARNPIGIGHREQRLPNIEAAGEASMLPMTHRVPAGFGPIAATWKPRSSGLGTYGSKWLKERWPWLPDDLDWAHFNAAPADQQVDGYLKGDEDLELLNLHPQYPVYRSCLPGLRTRAFIQVEFSGATPEFREVRLNLDTLWVDMDAEGLVLVWRGLTPVSNVKFPEVTHMFAFTESLSSSPCSLEEAQALMHHRIREEAGEIKTPEEEAEEAESAAAWAEFDKDMAAMDQERAEIESTFAALESQSAQEKERLVAEGIDPALLKGPAKPETIAEIKAALAVHLAGLAKTNPQTAEKLGGMEAKLGEFELMEQEIAALESGEPEPWTRESVLRAVAQGNAVKNADLSGQDFSNVDLSGADLSGTDFSGANLSGTVCAGATLTGVDFSGADLVGADLSNAHLDGADFFKARLERARFIGASIANVRFSDLKLSGTDFSDCRGEQPMFSSSDLRGVSFARATLPEADFCRANLAGASFADAVLTSADFGGACATGVDMQRADLTNLRAAEKADLADGKFSGVNAVGSIWEQACLDRADFSRARLSGSLFEGCSLNGASFDRADLTEASFDDAVAHETRLTNANLLRASLNRADLTAASLVGSNLYEAGFWEAVLRDTDLRDTNRKHTTIA